MSYSTIWKVYKTKAVSVIELGNSHGSAPPVWDWLCNHYLNGKHWMTRDDNKDLWQLRKNPAVPKHMRFGLLLTFDNAIILPIHLEEAAQLCYRVYDTTFNPQYVNHWSRIGEELHKLRDIKNKRLMGIALGCTSVSDPWWDRKSREPFNVMDYLDLEATP